jgi:small subunit ribosomal protein S3e
MPANYPISKKRKFIKDGIFFAEINEFLRRMLAEDGYAGVEIKPRPECTQIVIKCTKTPEVVKRIPYIQKLLQLRHKFANEEAIKVFAEKVQPRGLSARAQAQSICYKLKGGLAVRRACYGGLKFIMDNGKAKGVQIIISGKLRGARAKAMKFKEGYMITSGEAKKKYITEAVEHVLLRQGTIGVRVTIMMPHDPEGKMGVKEQLPDVVVVKNPKTYDDDDNFGAPQNPDDQMYGQQQQYQDQGGYGAPQQQQQQQQPAYGNDQAYGQQPAYGATPGGPPQQQQQQQYPPQGYGGPASYATPGYGDQSKI